MAVALCPAAREALYRGQPPPQPAPAKGKNC